MAHITSSEVVRARWSMLLTPALLLLAACGAAPDGTMAGAPADLAALAAPAPAVPSRPLTCVSPRRSSPVVKATGSITGDAPDHLTLAMLATGGVLVDAAAPQPEPGLDGGSWTTKYAFQPWALGAGYAGTYHLLLPASPIGESFNAYYLTITAAGVHSLKPLTCTAPFPVAPKAPAVAPPGPAVHAFDCQPGLVRATVAVTVSGGLDASGLPRDVRVTRVATGAVEAAAAAPAYLPAFDGGAWVTTSGLYAWGLDATVDVSHTLMLPLVPSGTFAAVAVTDYAVGGRVEVPLDCTVK